MNDVTRSAAKIMKADANSNRFNLDLRRADIARTSTWMFYFNVLHKSIKFPATDTSNREQDERLLALKQ